MKVFWTDAQYDSYVNQLREINAMYLKERNECLARELNATISSDTLLDKYCKKNFKEIPKIAYKQKRGIKGKYYTVSLHELITYDSYEVTQLMKGIENTIKSKADKVAKYLTWDDDKNLDNSGDYYLYPNEAIARKKCDCEDHAFVMMSCDKEVGGAWGYFGKTCHAFNVYVKDNELYIIETTPPDESMIRKWEGNDKDLYKIYIIITKDHAYRVKDGVDFGEIAGW